MGLPVPVGIKNKLPHEIYEGTDYEEFWTGISKHKLNELEQYLVRDLLPNSGFRIIDLGCGYGRLSDCYIKRFNSTFFFDGSMSLLHQARESTRGEGVYIAGDITRSPFKKCSFDAALMVRVFHHILDSRGCLSEINRILGPNGVLVFNYCNKFNPSHLVRWIFNRKFGSPLTYNSNVDDPWFITHHPTYIHRLLLATGFINLEYRGAGVVDKIAGCFGPLGSRFPEGKTAARIFGTIKISPWIFCSARSNNSEPIIRGDQLVDLLQCPSCSSDLFYEKNTYTCKGCFKRYPIIDEIIDFRIP